MKASKRWFACEGPVSAALPWPGEEALLLLNEGRASKLDLRTGKERALGKRDVVSAVLGPGAARGSWSS